MNLFQWLREWFNRKPGLLEHKPMPPLVRRIPGLPVDGDELTGDEKDQLALIAGLFEYLEAADPQEKP